MTSYVILTKPGCPHCDRAKQLLKIRGLEYFETVFSTPHEIETFKARGFRTFPQVFENGRHIGGADQLHEHLMLEEAF